MSSPASSSVDILPTYTRILNATLVSSHTGREPRMDCAVTVHVLYVCNAVWLVIEFPHRRAWDIPYPSTTLGDMTALVFQLPSSFQFTHHPGNRACRWTTVSSQEYRFSLVFFRDWEYLTLCNTVPQYIARMNSYGYGHTVDTHGAILVGYLSRDIAEDIWRHIDLSALMIALEACSDVSNLLSYRHPRASLLMATLDDIALQDNLETLKDLFNLQGLCDEGSATDPWSWPHFLNEKARELTGTEELVRVYLQYYRRLLRALGRLNRKMSKRKVDDLIDADWSNQMHRGRVDMSNISLTDLDDEEKRIIQASQLVDHVDMSGLQRKLPISDIEFLIHTLSILLKHSHNQHLSVPWMIAVDSAKASVRWL
ncbi:hypothetical protein C8Q76DRAFT_819043 [Earliella scabrosa]|nr:hypothetical protein C8Q76DRAFT_819043 [Earliella scabrosa]